MLEKKLIKSIVLVKLSSKGNSAAGSRKLPNMISQPCKSCETIEIITSRPIVPKSEAPTLQVESRLHGSIKKPLSSTLPLAKRTKDLCPTDIKNFTGVPVVAQGKWIWLVSIRTQVRSLASLSGLRIQNCWELWCKSVVTAPIRPLAWGALCAVC